MNSTPCLLVAIAALSASCASDPIDKRTIGYASGVSGTAAACCKTMAEAIGTPSVLTTSKTDLSPEAPHFDFGEGLSPFRAYAVEPDTKALEVHAPLQLAGWVFGGDGRVRHLNVVAHFYSLHGQELRSSGDERVVKHLGNGYRALFYYLHVPEGARTVVFSTDTRLRDVSTTVPAEDMPSTYVGTLGIVPIFLPASGSSTFIYANYSPVEFRALAEYPNRARKR